MGAREVEILDKIGAIHAHDLEDWMFEQRTNSDTREQDPDYGPEPGDTVSNYPGDEDFPPMNCYRLPGPNLQRTLGRLTERLPGDLEFGRY